MNEPMAIHPIDDECERELKRLLDSWDDPEVPQGLDARVLAAYRQNYGRPSLFERLFSVTIRVPLPVALAAALLLAVSWYVVLRNAPAAPPELATGQGLPTLAVVTHTDLSGFEPVQDLNVNVIPTDEKKR